jgi:ammonium transporter, Amt family
MYSDYIAALDGMTNAANDAAIPGGWLNQNYIQLAYQLADSVAGFSYSFVMTCLILFLMNLIPGLSLRVSPEEEELGIDDGQLGEFAYDYVELQRHTADILGTPELVAGSTPPNGEAEMKTANMV